MKAAVGLGNPGPDYADTRHNVGFRVVEELACRHGGVEFRRSGSARRASLLIGGEPVIAVEPLTFMNRSGRAVGELVTVDRVSGADLIVVHDDLDIDVGAVRIKVGGGHGGHNGLRSILEAEVGAGEFVRVRLGIGRNPDRPVVDWVLEPFLEEDRDTIAKMIQRGADAIEAILAQGSGRAMTEFNRRVKPLPPVDGGARVAVDR